jgi:hypothetical protein
MVCPLGMIIIFCNMHGEEFFGIFYGGPCRDVIRRKTGARMNSWKGATVQRRPEYKSRKVAIVGAVTRQLLISTL